MREHLTINDHTYDKVHIIEHADPIAGYCALITFALNGVRKALENNWLPVVNYDDNINDYFYDPAYGENTWDYYFEPVLGVDYATVKQLLDEGKLTQEDIHTYPAEQVLNWHHSDPERVTPFWAHPKPSDPSKWMAEKRQLGREFVANYIRVKPHILAKVEQFFDARIKEQYTIGVHIRGTDWVYAEPTTPETYFREIREFADNHNLGDFNLFVATDQKQFVDAFRLEFGERVITYDSMRSSNDVPAFLFKDVSPYRKGEDVLIDILLLSRCNYLFKCAAAAGEYALWFNPSLQCTDFALQSRWIMGNNIPAYLGLNIGELPSTQVRLLIFYGKRRTAVLEAVLRVGRMILPHAIRDWLWKKIGRHVYFRTGKAN